MRLEVFRTAVVRARMLPVIVLAALLLPACNIATQPSRTTPFTDTRNFIARSEPNQPLEPGRERLDYPLTARQPREPIVLMSISGGGSRSAYYAARVMEEMSQIPVGREGGSLLDCVRVISTVSAGSLAASWYITRYDERYSPDFFERFKKDMGVNLQWRTYGHMALFPPLAFQLAASNVTRTDLLATEIDRLLGGRNITFDDLAALEMREGDPAPVLIVNGTVYNSGQRLVMTNLPPTRFPSLIDAGSDLVAVSETDESIMRDLVRPVTFQDIGSDIGQFPVANAIAASAAYPIVLAPARLRVYADRVPPESRYRAGELLNSQSIYVADGGIIENEGVDALLSVIKSLDRDAPVLLVVIEATQRMRTTISDRGKIWDPITVISRMYDIGTMRPLAFYGSLVREFHDPKQIDGVVIRIEGETPEMEKQLRDIPTMFKLGPKHRNALDAAADANVDKMRENIIAAYDRLTSPKRRGR
jgi:predicted acylesterase/phospholipase RssA